MKLEPKHLAPYLPYKMVFVIDMYKFTEGNCKPEIRQFTMGNDLSMCLSYGTPILFPLSSLTKEITINGESFVPLVHNRILKQLCNESSLTSYYHLNLMENYEIISMLFELKFDVFGLIDAGLAETVTEDFNPYK